MTKLRSTVALSALLLLGAGAASAADLNNGGPRVSMKDEAPAPYRACSGDRFAGFYAGATAGMTAFNSKWEETSNDFGGSFLGAPQKNTDAGFTGGGTLGYNRVRCNTLFGIEADFNFADIGGEKVYLGPGVNTGGVGVINKLGDYATLRARLGFVADRTLFYATGGLAWADLRHALNDSYPNSLGNVHYGISGPAPDFNNWKLGWTVGGGFETAVTERISLKGEALYMDFGSRKYGFNDVGTPPDPYTFSNHTNAVTARVGINFKLGDMSRGCGDDCGRPLK